MRVLLRRLKKENWLFSRPVWRIDSDGVGVATYSVIGPKRTYTLVAFAHDLPDDQRSDLGHCGETIMYGKSSPRAANLGGPHFATKLSGPLLSPRPRHPAGCSEETQAASTAHAEAQARLNFATLFGCSEETQATLRRRPCSDAHGRPLGAKPHFPTGLQAPGARR